MWDRPCKTWTEHEAEWGPWADDKSEGRSSARHWHHEATYCQYAGKNQTKTGCWIKYLLAHKIKI